MFCCCCCFVFSSRWLRTFDTLHFKLFNLLNIHVFPLMLPFVYVQWIFACYILTIIKENHNERMFVSFYNLKSKSKTTTKTTKNKNKAKTQVCVSCFISIKIFCRYNLSNVCMWGFIKYAFVYHGLLLLLLLLLLPLLLLVILI